MSHRFFCRGTGALTQQRLVWALLVALLSAPFACTYAGASARADSSLESSGLADYIALRRYTRYVDPSMESGLRRTVKRIKSGILKLSDESDVLAALGVACFLHDPSLLDATVSGELQASAGVLQKIREFVFISRLEWIDDSVDVLAALRVAVPSESVRIARAEVLLQTLVDVLRSDRSISTCVTSSQLQQLELLSRYGAWPHLAFRYAEPLVEAVLAPALELDKRVLASIVLEGCDLPAWIPRVLLRRLLAGQREWSAASVSKSWDLCSRLFAANTPADVLDDIQAEVACAPAEVGAALLLALVNQPFGDSAARLLELLEAGLRPDTHKILLSALATRLRLGPDEVLTSDGYRQRVAQLMLRSAAGR